MNLLRLAFYLAVLSLSACSGVNMGQHVAASNYTGNPQRMFVISGFDRQFSERAQKLFEQELQDRLTQCGTESKIYVVDTIQLDASTKAKLVIDQFKPDAILDIRQVERDNFSGDIRGGVYVVSLQDLISKHEVWKAGVSLIAAAPGLSNRGERARNLARLIVTQMSTDGILRRCVFTQENGT